MVEAWDEEMVRQSFKRCSIPKSLDGAKDDQLTDCLASVDDAAEAGPVEHESLGDVALDFIFDSGTDVSSN